MTCTDCARAYPVDEGLPDLTHPTELEEQDRKARADYDSMAQHYDQGMQALSALLDWPVEEMARDRRRLVAALDVGPVARVLEVSVGTGQNFPALLGALSGQGCIVALDLSRGMLEVAQTKVQQTKVPVHFVLANASHLPFPDNAFDGVVHSGGVNLFAERKRALDEMVRVVRPGGRVLVSDESIPPWHRRTPRAERLIAGNSLYLYEPPFEDIPWSDIEDFHLDWIGNEVFYVFNFRKRG